MSKQAELQIFRRASAAHKAANGGPYLTIRANNQTLYIVGLDPIKGNYGEINLIDQVERERYEPKAGEKRLKSEYEVVGQITFRHLARLDNANYALTREEAPAWVANNSKEG